MSNVGGEAAQCPVVLPKLNFDNTSQKARKIGYYIFEALSKFAIFL